MRNYCKICELTEVRKESEMCKSCEDYVARRKSQSHNNSKLKQYIESMQRRSMAAN